MFCLLLFRVLAVIWYYAMCFFFSFFGWNFRCFFFTKWKELWFCEWERLMLSKPIIEVLATHLSWGGNSLCFYHSKPNCPIIVSFSFKISLPRGLLDFVVSHQHNLVKLMEDIVFSILDHPRSECQWSCPNSDLENSWSCYLIWFYEFLHLSVAGSLATFPPDSASIASIINYHAEFTPSFSIESFGLPKAFYATAESVRDMLIMNWNETYEYYEKLNVKQAYYLSMEFLQVCHESLSLSF